MTEEMYQYLHEIIAGRAHPNSGRDHSSRMAYTSCMYMLEYAHDGNLEALKNYDYGERAPHPELAGQIVKAMFKEVD